MGGALSNEEENILRLFSESGIPRNLAKILLYISKMDMRNEKKKKKKEKNFLYDYLEDLEEEEVEAEEDYIFYEILRYPPGSNPPTPDRNHSLHAEFMIFNSPEKE